MASAAWTWRSSCSARSGRRCGRASFCGGSTSPQKRLRRRTAFRRISLSPNGRSGALLVGTLDADGRFALTVTAATPRPVRLRLRAVPDADALRDALAAAIPQQNWYDDVHGAPDWRAHVTGLLAEEIRAELHRGAAA